MASAATETKKNTKNKLEEPRMYQVVFYNDDSTPVDFVIRMLKEVFRYDTNDATELTLKVHNEGSATVGIFSFEIAEQKATEVITQARRENHPFVVKIEAE